MLPPHQEPRTTTTTLDSTSSISPHNSSTPLISPEQRQHLQAAGEDTNEAGANPSKAGKRGLFGLGKKKEDTQPASSSSMDAPTPTPVLGAEQQQAKAQPIPLSPPRHPLPSAIAASPSRLRPSSPRLHSPASSEIFERDVQEPIPISTLGNELTPAHMPSHVMTEDSIPPALEASAQAITSEELNPDEVEIVMSASHQSAAATVLEASTGHADLLSHLNSPTVPPTLQHQKSDESEAASSLHASGIVPGVEDDSASNYGQLDPNDVRRVSFISFKDIVQSEHNEQLAASFGEVGNRSSMHMSSLPSGFLQQDGNRAASPLRSPRSPASTHSQSLNGGLATPPPGVNIDAAATSHTEQSPVRSIGIGSPGSQHGELTIETMRQALRKTASGDLSNVRSAGLSPVTLEEASSLKEPPRSHTNTNA